MSTKKKSLKKELTLFFENEQDCLRAKEALGQTRRRVVKLDKLDDGSYSAFTGHYGIVSKSGNVYRVPIRYKLIIDSECFEMLTWEQKQDLRFVDGDSTSWIS